MNTIEKGDAFEEKAARIISKMLNEYELGLIPAHCKVFSKKGYYSQKRRKKIIFDISIEVWPPEASNYILLYLIECKDYSDSISVDKIESFSKKIEQISEHNTKGIFITTNKLQEAAESLCKSEGIMLVMCKGEMAYDIVFHLVKSKELRDKHFGRQIIPLEGLLVPEIRELILNSWSNEIESRVLRATNNLIPRNTRMTSNRPILSREEIEDIALQVLNLYRRTRILEEQHIEIDSFIAFIEDLFNIRIRVFAIRETDTSGNPIIAKCDFFTDEIIIDVSLQSTDRFLFHLCHELGHYVLHKNIDLEQDQYEVMSESVVEQRNRKGDLQTEREWIEWHANEFAVNIVLPKDALAIKMSVILSGMGRRLDRQFYLDDQEGNKKDFAILIDTLAKYFLVSKTVVNNRLDQLNYVNRVSTKSGPRRIGDILNNP